MRKQSYTLDLDEYMSSRVSSLEDAMIIEKANSCVSLCQKPAEIVKKVISENFNYLQNNIQSCVNSCDKTKKNKDDEPDYACLSECLDKNMIIIKDLDKRMNDSFLKHMDSLFQYNF